MERVLIILPVGASRDRFVKETSEIEHAGYSYGVVYYDLNSKEESFLRILLASVKCRFVYCPEEENCGEFEQFVRKIFEYMKKPMISFHTR